MLESSAALSQTTWRKGKSGFVAGITFIEVVRLGVAVAHVAQERCDRDSSFTVGEGVWVTLIKYTRAQ